MAEEKRGTICDTSILHCYNIVVHDVVTLYVPGRDTVP